MQFKFPASEEEKKLVHEKLSELKKSLSHSADLIEDLFAYLEDSELAISNEYRQELVKENIRIESKLFEINCRLYWVNHKDRQERIIHPIRQEDE